MRAFFAALLLLAGCGQPDAQKPRLSPSEPLVVLSSQPFGTGVEIEVQRDGSWSGMCELQPRAESLSGQLTNSELAAYTRRVSAIGEPLTLRQTAGPTDATITHVEVAGRTVQTTELAIDLAGDLYSLGYEACSG